MVRLKAPFRRSKNKLDHSIRYAVMVTLSILVTIGSCAVFSFGYLYFLGLRIIRTRFNEKLSAFFLGLVVCSGILAATVSLEAVVLIPNTTKKIHYIVGSTLIFSKASETNSIAVKEAKNSFDFDWNR